MKLLFLLTIVGLTSAEKMIGKLSSLAHGVSGDVYAKDSKTIVVKNFKYDGNGPDAFFWIGKTGTPSKTDESMTMILTKEKQFLYRDNTAPILKKHDGETVELPLPEGWTLNDLKWFSVWCRKFSVDFGNVMIPADFKLDGDIPHPLAPSAEPEPEPEDHDGHKHDYPAGGAGAEPEPENEPEPEPKDLDGTTTKKPGSTAASPVYLATSAAILLVVASLL